MTDPVPALRRRPLLELDPVAYRRNLVRSVPFVLAVPVVIGLVIVASGVPLDPVGLIAGAIGWSVALVLRAPVAIVSMRIEQDRRLVQPWITGASGPAEELVRLGVLLLVGRDLPLALSIGLGWAAIEVVYSLVNGVAILALMGRTDPEAEQARSLMPTPEVLRSDAPLWGVVERAWASVLHVAFTLIVAAVPLFVILTTVAHSMTNLLLLRWGAAWSIRRLQVAGILWAGFLLLAAAVLWLP
jgi:hypothetical protein